jgi:hypothetical protein
MVFVGSIWKGKSDGWFPFVMSLGLSVATEIVLTAAGSIIDMGCNTSKKLENKNKSLHFGAL